MVNNINRATIVFWTILATILYVVIEFAVDEKPFSGGLFEGDYWPEGSWLRWLALILIPVLGSVSAYQIGHRSINVPSERVATTDGQVGDPALWRAISGNTWLSVAWLPVRFVLGIHWLQAGWHKTQEAGWALSGTNTETGEHIARGASMKGFLMGAYTPNPETGQVKAVFGWYADLLEYIVNHGWTSWLGPMIAWGEVLVGFGLLLGGLVGIAAFFGTTMNMSFMLAGTVSANPWMFGMTVFIILGYKVAGHFGLDRWLLPILGTPWNHRNGNPTTSAEDAVEKRAIT